MKKKLNMKIFALLLGTWFIAMISVVIGVNLYDNHQAAQYDDRAVPYIKNIIPVISHWDPATTRNLMSPEALEGVSDELFSEVIAVFSKLGELRSVEEPTFKKVYTEEETEIGTVVAYSTEAKYANGDAVIAIQLLVRDDSFEVFRFNLSSNALANQ